LYLDVIPITLKNTITLYFSTYFPIILLNDWDDINIDKLKTEYNKFKINSQLLHFDYIISQIQ